MQNAVLLFTLLVCLGPYGALSATNLTVYLEDYIVGNQRQYDAKLKQCETELANIRLVYTGSLRAISIQTDQLEVRLTEAKERLTPIELIDSWHKECVQNQSKNIPDIATVRKTLNACASTAESNINSILTNAQNTYNSLKSYYANNLKNLLADCLKRYPDSLTNYTVCIKQAVS